jgi:asparagine synthase (glutamine-hydrolysing)
MCGIFGIFSRPGLTCTRSALVRANRLAAHRGPDGAGITLFNLGTDESRILVVDEEGVPEDVELARYHAVLGHRRLAILDLSSAGHQPMRTNDGALWITYNGEIYNYIELRAELRELGFEFTSASDTEVILHAYRAWGPACVHRFNGMWAFALLDIKQRRLICSRDRFGIKPFHFVHAGDVFAFASEIKQLLVLPFVRKEINRQALYEYLVYGSFDHAADTFLEGVSRLAAGHSLVLDFDRGVVEIDRYYSPAIGINRAISPQEAASEFRRLFTDSVRLQLRSDVEVGSCLSGGLDSSSIVCAVHRLLAQESKNT